MAYLTKDKANVVQLWNRKPELVGPDKDQWAAWIIKGFSNEIAVDVSNNDLMRNAVTFESSPLEFHYLAGDNEEK